MSIYFFGPDAGRVVSVHDSDKDDCNVRDRDRKLIPHKHLVMKFGENLAKCCEGSTIIACDFQLKADGGWAEIEDAIAKATITPGKENKPHNKRQAIMKTNFGQPPKKRKST